MDAEMGIKYKNLLVHHLEKDEVEFELDIRLVPFEKTETLSVLRRRLREKLKREKGEEEQLDFQGCEGRTIDGEIKIIDKKVQEISDYLEKKKEYEGLKDSLGTRLVHYFARCLTVQETAETDEDLEDLDKLMGSIRRLYGSYFTLFSPIESIRKEVMLQITNSLSQLHLQQQASSSKSSKGKSKGQQRSQETQTEEDGESQGNEGSKQSSSGTKQSSSGASKDRRQLRSCNKHPESNFNLSDIPSSLLKPSGSGKIPNRHKERIVDRIVLSCQVKLLTRIPSQ